MRLTFSVTLWLATCSTLQATLFFSRESVGEAREDLKRLVGEYAWAYRQLTDAGEAFGRNHAINTVNGDRFRFALRLTEEQHRYLVERLLGAEERHSNFVDSAEAILKRREAALYLWHRLKGLDHNFEQKEPQDRYTVDRIKAMVPNPTAMQVYVGLTPIGLHSWIDMMVFNMFQMAQRGERAQARYSQFKFYESLLPTLLASADDIRTVTQWLHDGALIQLDSPELEDSEFPAMLATLGSQNLDIYNPAWQRQDAIHTPEKYSWQTAAEVSNAQEDQGSRERR